MTSMIRVIAAVFVLSSTASAQLTSNVAPGARIRSIGSGGHVTGTVLEASTDSMVVRHDDNGRLVVLRYADINTLEIARGRNHHTRTGLVAGLLVGGGAGALIGYLEGDDSCDPVVALAFTGCTFVMSAQGKAVLGGLGFGLLGASAGAIVGYLWTTDRWISVGPRPVSVSPIVAADGRFGVSLRF